MSTPGSISSESLNPEIITTRVFDAPRDLVFSAFSNPDHLRHWWGPNGFTNTINTFDFRPGGAWHLVMHAPNGAEFHNESEFVEVVKPERIVFDHLRPMHWFRIIMNFDDVAGKTRLTWRMRFDSAEEYEKMKNFIPTANEQNFDRLAAHLKTMAAPS
jgi:uncharacterized protein YndB with AHSA1/START domain